MRRFAFVVEIAALYAFVCLMGWLFNDGAWSFPGQPLHPFLLVVAIEATQYGLRPALLASGLGLGLYLIGARGLGPSDSLPMLAIMATGILMGLAQESRNRQLREARGELERARSEQDRLRQRISVLDLANKELSERILGEITTVSSFSELARRLSVLERRDLFPAICELVNDYLSATRSSVYSLAGTELELKAARGFAVVPDSLKAITDKESLAWIAVTEKATMSALDLLSRQPTGKLAKLREGEFPILLAAPIIDEATGLVTGVVCVNNLPFAKFHGASKKILGVIARWAGDALHNAAIVERLREQATDRPCP
jgi:hypothetical protein